MANDRSAFGVNTYSYIYSQPADECLTHLADLGYRDFELMMYPGHAWPAKMSVADRRNLLKVIADHHLRVHTLNMPNLDLNVTAANPEMRALSLKDLGEIVELAGELGVPGVVLGPGKPNPLFPNPTELLLGWFCDALDVLIPAAAKAGTRLLAENMPFGFLPRADQMVAALDGYGSDEVGIVYDVANAVFAREDPVGDEGIQDQGGQSEHRDGAHRVAHLVLAGVDGGARGHDGGVAADRGSHGHEGSEASRESEGATDAAHHEQRGDDAPRDHGQRDEADGADRREAQPDAQQRHADAENALESELEPDLVDPGKPHGVADRETGEDRDQDRADRRLLEAQRPGAEPDRELAAEQGQDEGEGEAGDELSAHLQEGVAAGAPAGPLGPLLGGLGRVHPVRDALHAPDEAEQLRVPVGIAGGRGGEGRRHADLLRRASCGEWVPGARSASPAPAPGVGAAIADTRPVRGDLTSPAKARNPL